MDLDEPIEFAAQVWSGFLDLCRNGVIPVEVRSRTGRVAVCHCSILVVFAKKSFFFCVMFLQVWSGYGFLY